MADKIVIPEIPVWARVGCFDEERRDPQQILVDLELGLDLRPVAAADSINAAIDYVAVRAAVEEIAAEKPYHLIETIAERIASRLVADFPIETAFVRVKKPSALARFGVAYAAVEIYRNRDG